MESQLLHRIMCNIDIRYKLLHGVCKALKPERDNIYILYSIKVSDTEIGIER